MSFFSKRIVFFMTVAKYKSLRRSSEELDVSISLLSKGISALEKQLCIKLFERRAEGMVLTQDGELLYTKMAVGYEKINRIQALIPYGKSFNGAVCGLPFFFLKEMFEQLAKKNNFKTFHLVKEKATSIETRHSQYDIIYTCDRLSINHDYFTWSDTLCMLSKEDKVDANNEIKLVQSYEFSNTEVFKNHLLYFDKKKVDYSLSIIDDLDLRLSMISEGYAQSMMSSSLLQFINCMDINIIHFPKELEFQHYIYCNELSYSTLKIIEKVLNHIDIDWRFESSD